ncbi:MAG TPA: DUF3618 domain-containing protein [Chloroflexota bacterium]
MGEATDRLTGTDPNDDALLRDETVDPAAGSLTTPGIFADNMGGTAPYSEGDSELYTAQVPAGVPADDFGNAEADTNDDIEQSRAQIEHTRSEMSETIDAIQEKLSPQHLARQAKDTVRDATVGKAQEMVNDAGQSAKGFGSTVVETIKENPVPAALAGIGLGWLFMSGRKQSSSTSSYSPRYEYDRYGSDGTAGGRYADRPAGSSVGSRVSQAQNKMGDLASQAQDQVSDVASQVQGTAGQVAGQIQTTTGQLTGTAQYGAQQAGSTFQQMVRDNPLGVGVVAVAVGAAIGLSIPESDRENQLLGETRDQVMEQAQQTVQQKAQQVQAVAQQTVGAAKDTAQQAASDQGLTKQ